ncbi:MAG TPA: hypothetical protein VN285_05445, partial [Candidatus Deferrimicrobium sp.]|nr:hypothetical protein [Candidatus Deferrimicrobium sp.]
RELIARVDYVSVKGKVFKMYQTLTSVNHRGVWLPATAKVAHLENGATTTIKYTYWPLTNIPGEQLFAPDTTHGTFFDRLDQALKTAGIAIDTAAAPSQTR